MSPSAKLDCRADSNMPKCYIAPWYHCENLLNSVSEMPGWNLAYWCQDYALPDPSWLAEEKIPPRTATNGNLETRLELYMIFEKLCASWLTLGFPGNDLWWRRKTNTEPLRKQMHTWMRSWTPNIERVPWFSRKLSRPLYIPDAKKRLPKTLPNQNWLCFLGIKEIICMRN